MASMGTGHTGTFEINEHHEQTWDFARDTNGCTIAPPFAHDVVSGTAGGIANSVTVGSDNSDVMANICTNFAGARITVNGSWGPPLPLWFFPDGMEILEAKAEISSSGLTRSFWETGMDDPDTTITNLDYLFIGFTSLTTFEVVGRTSGATQNQKVLDVTDIMQVMYDERATGKYAYGYGAAFFPTGIETGVSSLMPTEMPPYSSDPASAPCTEWHKFHYGWNLALSWDSISVGEVAFKIKYPQEERERLLIMPRWPSMAPVTP